MKKNLKRGFTLIELLVVIAIIGILSSIVLISLNAAREKGNDAKTKAQLSSAREAAQLYYDSNNSYNGLAGDVDGTVLDCLSADTMFQDIDSGMIRYTDLNNYPDIGTKTIRCSSNGVSYVISISMSTAGEFWCVDSESVSRQISAADHITAHPDNDTGCD